MKYTVEIEINKPIQDVIALFDDPNNLKEWMEGLLSFEHLSGERGFPGAKSMMRFNMGGKEIEMIETITVRNLPHEFSGTYEAKGVFNVVKNFFYPVGDNKTKYVSEQEFIFSGSMKLIGLMMPGAFKKESMKHLTNFKRFAEKG